MGLYKEQIESRIKNDSDSFEESFAHLASVVMGRKAKAETFLSDRESAKSAIDDILKFYHIVPGNLPSDVSELDEQLEFLLRPHGVMRRAVELTGDWHKNSLGPLLGRTTAGQPVALIPGKSGGYTYFDHAQGKRVKVTAATAAALETEAVCFYKPFPAGKIGVKNLLLFMARSLAPSDYVFMVACSLAAVLFGMILPFANQQIFSHVIPSGQYLQLIAVSSLLVGATVSTMLIRITKGIVEDRIRTKLEMAVESASMARLLSLPMSFFKGGNSGEIAHRLQSMASLCGVLCQVVLGMGLAGVFSLIYIGQIAVMTPVLALPALAIISASIVLSITKTLLAIKSARKKTEGMGKLKGLTFSLISGIQKIKLTGSEKRAFAKWAKKYTENAALTFDSPIHKKINIGLTAAISLFGNIIILGLAAAADINAAEFMAFNVAYGLASGGVVSLAAVISAFSSVKPTLETAKPFMDAVPEISAGKRTVSRLSGSIEISGLSFRYDEDMPLVIDNLSLKINSGQYVAVVGASGCGKSTLMRLLLGFEAPQKGAIYYDGNDMRTVDLKSLRKHIGCVMQDGRLFSGTVFENIAISAPRLTLEEAWEAAETAGIADNIKAMPMQMNTLISEGGGGTSGGQRQRLLIARAVAPKPKILLMDEATSALDNITQRQVAEALDALKCTRIVIAHRISTIKECDRVILLDNGRIAEDGTFDELLARRGQFAELVERQKIFRGK